MKALVLSAFLICSLAPAAPAAEPTRQVTQYVFTLSVPEDWVKSPDAEQQGYNYESPEKTEVHGIPLGRSVLITKTPAPGATLAELKEEFDTMMQSSAAKVNAFLQEHTDMASAGVSLSEIDKYQSSIETVDGHDWILAKGVTALETPRGLVPMKSLVKCTLVDGELYSAYVTAPLVLFEAHAPELEAVYNSIAFGSGD